MWLALKPDGVFLSNGPGDPEPLEFAAAQARQLVGKVPIFGICLGHQILGLAMGGKTYKLKFGHRGGNHPVLNQRTNKVEITAQNHGFCVDPDSLKAADIELTHVNLNDGTLEVSATGRRRCSVCSITRRRRRVRMIRSICSMISAS